MALAFLGPQQRVERDRIVATLDACAGNQTRAAKTLGVSRAILLARGTDLAEI